MKFETKTENNKVKSNFRNPNNSAFFMRRTECVEVEKDEEIRLINKVVKKGYTESNL